MSLFLFNDSDVLTDSFFDFQELGLVINLKLGGGGTTYKISLSIDLFLINAL